MQYTVVSVIFILSQPNRNVLKICRKNQSAGSSVCSLRTDMTKLTSLLADPDGRAVKGVGLRPLGCWDFGFQSRAVMFICSVCRVARQQPLRRAGHSFRGVLAGVCVFVCACVI